jgi:polysaccharide pyruvyl transferase WcaK-like protein
MNLVVPFGFYGWGNIGDESTLQGFARLAQRFDPKLRVWVASRNVSHTARIQPSFKYYKAVGTDPMRWWGRWRSDAAAFVGGTPIMDVLGEWPLSEVAPLVSAAYSEGKPIAFVGVGTERLQNESSRRTVAEVLAPKVVHWSVRSERDKKRLTDCGVRPESITAAADMAWLLDPVTTDFGKQYLRRLGLALNEPYVGVNVNSESFMLDQEPRLFEKLGLCLDELVVRYGVRVLFLCNEVREDDMFDRAASLKIQASMTHKERTFLVPNEYLTPQQMQSLIGCCQATLSTRYHFCLFSALQQVPFLALERSDKVADLCWDMRWPYRASLCKLKLSLAGELLADVEKKNAELTAQLAESVGFMRQRAWKNEAALAALASTANAQNPLRVRG